MSWTQDDVKRLKVAIASGQLSVRHGDRQVTYQSVEAMLTALDRMESELAAAAPARKPATRRYRFTTLRGF
ncbi:hypothetical protein C1924_15150 [Stenotrophomonas sp. ESTM1D_MKCIP4_1]|uniref:phage head-tail joining protein n=1 Tax=Stenotrophomonas sp. ESTM1D_MKCIP4_1 TaxID=2072414 RepID=UPI000D540620|nr:hypothetical protein [Stenotrophomonas sp. ESTM1D_MKCIP4_1]AWH54421.1 hypothetical protein C1924_15150 [Stenotrophomonas sp. ESTM1D_MKCIP4_1]